MAGTHVNVIRTGGPEVLTLSRTDPGDLAAGDVRVELAAAGINYLDVYHRSGTYPRPTPFTPGFEGAGTIIEVGAEVSSLTVGDRVAYAMVPNSYAQIVDVPAWRAVAVPDVVGLDTAAAVILQGMTAHYLIEVGRLLSTARTALVHAAAGGVGHLLVQLAAAAGIRVIGTASTAEKRRFVTDLGAEVVLDSTDLTSAAIVEASDGGVDVVFDGVGGPVHAINLEVLGSRGAVINFGEAGGPLPPIDARSLATSSLVFTKTSLAHFTADADAVHRRAGGILAAVADGRVSVQIDSTFPLGKAADAHRRLESRASSGKVLLTTDDRSN